MNYDTGCYSHVGRTDKDELRKWANTNNKTWYTDGQPINLERRGCMSRSTITHEMIHALGYYHEQSRPDRNESVIIKYANIIQKHWHNFEWHGNTFTFGVPYDLTSIMHYKWDAFSKSRGHLPSIIPKKQGISQTLIGSSLVPTIWDIEKIKRMYDCNSKFRDKIPYSDVFHYLEIDYQNLRLVKWLFHNHF